MAQALIEKNIVVIGEKGVGKSSFLNNLALILNFATFEEAENGANGFMPPITVRTNFVRNALVQDEDENERDLGTLNPRIYRITCENVVFNFIDTPGMVHPAGHKVDVEHMKQIITCLGQFNQLHGILVLMSCNYTSSINFKYTLNMVLSCLGKTAAKIISFGITYAGYNKNAGTVPDVIRNSFKGLKNNPGIDFSKNNFYYFDNIPLLRVLSTKKGATTNERDKQICTWTYENNVDQLLRYLSMVYNRKDSYHVINVSTLTIAKCIQPALVSQLLYLERMKEEIKTDLDHQEKESATRRSENWQNRYALKQIRQWSEEYQEAKMSDVKMNFDWHENLEPLFGRVICGLTDEIGQVVCGIGNKQENHEGIESYDGRNEKEDPLVKEILEKIANERTKIRNHQLQNCSLYQKFQAEKNMVSGLLGDLTSYLEEHAIVTFDDSGFGSSGDSEIAIGIQKRKTSSQWKANSKNIEAAEIFARLTAIKDLHYFGNEINKILSKCKSMEHAQYRLVDIPVVQNSGFIERLALGR